MVENCKQLINFWFAEVLKKITHNFTEVDNIRPLITSGHLFFVLLFFDGDRTLSHGVRLMTARHWTVTVMIKRTLFLTSAGLTEILAAVVNVRASLTWPLRVAVVNLWQYSVACTQAGCAHLCRVVILQGTLGTRPRVFGTLTVGRGTQ